MWIIYIAIFTYTTYLFTNIFLLLQTFVTWVTYKNEESDGKFFLFRDHLITCVDMIAWLWCKYRSIAGKCWIEEQFYLIRLETYNPLLV